MVASVFCGGGAGWVTLPVADRRWKRGFRPGRRPYLGAAVASHGPPGLLAADTLALSDEEVADAAIFAASAGGGADLIFVRIGI
jgi:hypothetical protein